MRLLRQRRETIFRTMTGVLLTGVLTAAPGWAWAEGPAPAPEAGPPAVPVTVAPVTRSDVPIVLRGLGTVQAYYAVQVRTQVDGVLVNIPVTEGQQVKKGDLLAVIDPRPYQATLDAAQAKKRQDEALLANAQADLQRYSSLARQDFASHQQVDTQTALVRQFTAAISGDEALIETAQVNLGFCAIKAPFDGRVGIRNVDPGNFVRAAEATPILPVAQLQPIAVTFTLPQDQMPAIQTAMAEGKPPVIAFSSDNSTELDRGTLLTLDNAIDPSTGTIKLKAIFPNQDSRLWPGQFVNARLIAGMNQAALTVPSAAVQHGQDRMFVYVVKPDQTVALAPVVLARDNGVTAMIAKGLEEGQQVVVDGQSRLRPGARVTIIGGAPKQAANDKSHGG
jgi:membrane fusion protein, multidrug efflux system